MATVTASIDKRKSSQLKNGEYPIKLWVYHNGRQFRVGTGLHSSLNTYERYRIGKKATKESRILGEAIQAELAKAQAVLENLSVITPDGFKRLYNSGSLRRYMPTSNLRDLYDAKIQKLAAAKQFSSKISYECALANIQRFAKAKLKTNPDKLSLEEITSEVIGEYEDWNLREGKVLYDRISAGNSISTVRSYLRTLRYIFNQAIDSKLLSKEAYPFGRNRYSIGISVAAKIALSEKQKDIFENYEPVSEVERRAKDAWFACFA